MSMRNDIEPIYKTIGKNIKRIRRIHHVSQADLAYCLDSKLPLFISDIERGKKRIQIHHLIAIAAFFGVSIQDLLTEESRPC